jgi:3-(3-hydroxy-phenyl)propionate hydroxylase
VRGTGNRRRWEIAVLDDEADVEVASQAGTWQLLSRWLTAQEAELERTAVYTFNSCIACRWRLGRLLIAGDAAHQTPPFMGQGLCTGIRDVANLAWKLALCVNGEAQAELLDTYQSERHPHVRAYIEMAVKLGRLINMDDPKQALEAAFAQPDGSARMSSITPSLGRGLAAGDASHAGRLAPQLTMSSGRRLDDVCGYRFVLVCEPELLSAAGLSDAEPEQSDIRTVCCEHGSTGSEYLSTLGARAVVIRPDRYILGSANSVPELHDLIAASPSI